MKSRLRSGAIALAVMAGAGVALAQTTMLDVRLQLSESQKQQIYKSIAGDSKAPLTGPAAKQPPTEVRIGASIPSEVKLLDLPAPTVKQVPVMERYKYVVVGGDVAIVDPGSRQIVEIIRQ
jgi:hypothetical protein